MIDLFHRIWRRVKILWRVFWFPARRDVLMVEAIASRRVKEKLVEAQKTYPTLDQVGRERIDKFTSQLWHDERGIAYHDVAVELALDYFGIMDNETRKKIDEIMRSFVIRYMQRLAFGDRGDDPLWQERLPAIEEILGDKAERFERFYLVKWKDLGMRVRERWLGHKD